MDLVLLWDIAIRVFGNSTSFQQTNRMWFNVHGCYVLLQVCNDPLMFLYDTPGIVTPRIESAEVALKLAACNTVVSHIVEEEVICDYILYTLNKLEKFK